MTSHQKLYILKLRNRPPLLCYHIPIVKSRKQFPPSSTPKLIILQCIPSSVPSSLCLFPFTLLLLILPLPLPLPIPPLSTQQGCEWAADSKWCASVLATPSQSGCSVVLTVLAPPNSCCLRRPSESQNGAAVTPTQLLGPRGFATAVTRRCHG